MGPRSRARVVPALIREASPPGSRPTPTLLVRPGLDDPAFFVDEGRPCLRDLLHDSWRRVDLRAVGIEEVTIPSARVFVWKDRPGATDEAIGGFLKLTRQGG